MNAPSINNRKNTINSVTFIFMPIIKMFPLQLKAHHSTSLTRDWSFLAAKAALLPTGTVHCEVLWLCGITAEEEPEEKGIKGTGAQS